MKSLWRKHPLPPKVREVLWPLAIGNVLSLTEDLIGICGDRAKAVREGRDRKKALPPEEEKHVRFI